MRIVHCFTDIGGNASGLARAQRALGAEAEMISFVPSALGFSGDAVLVPEGAGALRRERLRLGFLWRALRHFDVVHFYFADTLLTPSRYPHAPLPAGASRAARLHAAYARAVWMKDLPLLKAAGKTIAMTFLGDDIRTLALARRHNPESHLLAPENAALHAGLEADKVRIVARAARYADLIYATNPDLLALLPERAAFLPYTCIDPAEIAPRPIRTEGPLRIMHAPTHRITKGTPHVLAAVEALKAAGSEIEFRLIENLPHQEARRLMQDADIFVDQLRVGWYGGSCVEAMAMGAVAVAYLHGPDIALSPFGASDLPIVSATAHDIEVRLAGLLQQDRAALHRLAGTSVAFVRRHHDPARIAARVLGDYRAVRH